MYTEKEDKEQRRPLSVTWWKSKGKDDVDNSLKGWKGIRSEWEGGKKAHETFGNGKVAD